MAFWTDLSEGGTSEYLSPPLFFLGGGGDTKYEKKTCILVWRIIPGQYHCHCFVIMPGFLLPVSQKHDSIQGINYQDWTTQHTHTHAHTHMHTNMHTHTHTHTHTYTHPHTHTHTHTSTGVSDCSCQSPVFEAIMLPLVSSCFFHVTHAKKKKKQLPFIVFGTSTTGYGNPEYWNAAGLLVYCIIKTSDWGLLIYW